MVITKTQQENSNFTFHPEIIKSLNGKSIDFPDDEIFAIKQINNSLKQKIINFLENYLKEIKKSLIYKDGSRTSEGNSKDDFNKEIEDELRDVFKYIKQDGMDKDNWDGEGSKGYLEETWKKTKNLIIKILSGLWSIKIDFKRDVPIPYVAPARDGGFEIFWTKLKKFGMAIYIPSYPMKYVKVFGIDYDNNRKIEDLFDLTINYKFADKAIIEWLMEILNG